MKVLILGASGSAGGSVLHACLSDGGVERVHAISRRPLPVHQKLRVFIHNDYMDYTNVREAFTEVEACLFCLGKSMSQVSNEAEYRTITHDYAIAAAHALLANSPPAAFHYVSGQGTNVNSRMMWARVKGETERELIDIVAAVCWRPGAIDGEQSASAPLLYRLLMPVYRLLKPFRSLYIDGEDLGRAMLQATRKGVRSRIIENAEIRDIAESSRQTN